MWCISFFRSFSFLSTCPASEALGLDFWAFLSVKDRLFPEILIQLPKIRGSCEHFVAGLRGRKSAIWGGKRFTAQPAAIFAFRLHRWSRSTFVGGAVIAAWSTTRQSSGVLLEERQKSPSDTVTVLVCNKPAAGEQRLTSGRGMGDFAAWYILKQGKDLEVVFSPTWESLDYVAAVFFRYCGADVFFFSVVLDSVFVDARHFPPLQSYARLGLVDYLNLAHWKRSWAVEEQAWKTKRETLN